MLKEEELRKQAIDLYQKDMKIAEISRQVGRSRQWVYKWIERYEAGSEEWCKSLSNAPKTIVNTTNSSIEQEVIEARKRLTLDPHMLSGAYPIYHDLKDRGITPPSISTINRILRKNGLSRKEKAQYSKSGLEYPEAPFNLQLMDLIGPRYIRGGERFYLLSIISNDTRHAGLYPILSKSGEDITQSVVAFWKSYGMPDFLQLDNELSFKGSNRHPRGLGMLMRTALSLNVTPIFIPVSEPWRNGVVERFNQRVEETFLMQNHSSFEELKEHAAEFVETHNAKHHYSPLWNKTPIELDKEIEPAIVQLSQDYVVDGKPPLDCYNINEIVFIRLVRSDLLIDVLNTPIKINSSMMHTYVEACLMINEHILVIRQDGRIKQIVEFAMPVI